jgi:hypothetical protein
MVVTNVPGPKERLSFAGVPIDGVLVWAPCSGSIGMTVSIFSYAGGVTTGFMTDAALVPDPAAYLSAAQLARRQLGPIGVSRSTNTSISSLRSAISRAAASGSTFVSVSGLLSSISTAPSRSAWKR